MIVFDITDSIHGDDLLDGLNSNFTELDDKIDTAVANLSDYLGLSPAGGTTSDHTQIQAAIDAASAAGGGIITLYQGNWYLTTNIILKSNVHINIDKNANFTFPVGYSGYVFRDPQTSALINCHVSGGKYTCNTSMDFMYLGATNQSTNYIMGCRFSDLYVTTARYMFNFYLAGGSYINFNTFENMTSWNCVGTIYSSIGAGSGAISVNSFSNFYMEALTNTTFGLNLSRFVSNQFTALQFSDFHVGAAKTAITLQSNSITNVFISPLNLPVPPNDVVDNGGLANNNIHITQYSAYFGIRSMHIGGHIFHNMYSGALTDGAPTANEIIACTSDDGLHPQYDAGWQGFLKDTSGTGLMYWVGRDGTDFYYLPLTKAL